MKDSEEESAQPSREQEPLSPTSLRSEPLYDGEIHVGSGEHEAVHFHLSAADKVQGVVKARYGYDFDVYLMDEKNYSKFLNGKRTREIWADTGVSASTLDADVPESGLWYLVLDLYGKQLDREITVRLRRVPAA